MNKDILRRKLEYCSPEELLLILLNDTDFKFKKAISYWENNDVEGTKMVSKIVDNIFELSATLDTTIGDEEMRKALRNISSLYQFIIDESITACPTRNVEKLKAAYKVYLDIKDIFVTDIKNSKK